jgi:steroid delta-isomerase-like uncharacterized protein
MAQDGKSLLLRLTDLANSDDLDKMDELVSDDFVYRSSGYPELHGPEGWKEIVREFRRAFPDMHITSNTLVAEGDLVVHHYTVSGTHRGEFYGIAPTGRQVSIDTLALVRIANGKMTSNFEITDNLDVMQQLGVIEKELVPESQL